MKITKAGKLFEREKLRVPEKGERDMRKRNAQKAPSQKLTFVFLAAALGMCLFGAARGDMEAVFMKAATICMECIGLG